MSGCKSNKTSQDETNTYSAPQQYNLRSENNLNFYIEIDGVKALYYYYCEYKKDSFAISVDVVDSHLTSSNVSFEYNDNIEFNIQPLCNDLGYSPGKTYDIMLNLAQSKGWLRKGGENFTLLENQMDEYIEKGLFSYRLISRHNNVDGYDGATVEIDLSYELWGSSYESLCGKLTIEPAARNCEPNGNEFRSYAGHGCRFCYSYTAVVVNKNGSFSKNNGEVSELSSLMRKKDLLKKEKDLISNFASLVDETKANIFSSGAQLFNDREYFVLEDAFPIELNNKTFIYHSIDEKTLFTIDNPGYIVLLVPHEGYADLHSSVDSMGFELINDIPGKQIAVSMNSVVGIKEQSDYYVRWCENGETFAFNKWCLVFSKEISDYPVINIWERELAHVEKLSSESKVANYSKDKRLWQGIPGIEWSKRNDGGQRLWACFYSGGQKEPSNSNYSLYCFSDNDGSSWNLAFVIDYFNDNNDFRCFDPSIKWHNGKLYLYWNQTGDGYYTSMVCCAVVNNPGISIDNISDINNFEIDKPFFCSKGIKMNKPVILTNGEWIYASHDPTSISFVMVFSSLDDGLTWSLKGRAKVENSLFVTESTLIQIDDNAYEIILYSRTDISYNQAVSYSHDGGVTWTVSQDNGRKCPSARQFALRLQSGNVLFAHHYNSYKRENLFIGLSTNRCKSFDHNLILDVREGTSYPDITESDDGFVYIIWDYDRYGARKVFFAKLAEKDLLKIDGAETMQPSLIKEIVI